eukprot:6357367-Amphidinium_carterae.1
MGTLTSQQCCLGGVPNAGLRKACKRSSRDVNDGECEKEVEEVLADTIEAGEVERTEVNLLAAPEPVNISKFMALRLVYGSASQKDLAAANQP